VQHAVPGLVASAFSISLATRVGLPKTGQIRRVLKARGQVGGDKLAAKIRSRNKCSNCGTISLRSMANCWFAGASVNTRLAAGQRSS